MPLRKLLTGKHFWPPIKMIAFTLLIFQQSQASWYKLEGVSLILTTSFMALIIRHKQRSIFSKFQVIPMLRFQVIHDTVLH